MKKQLLVAGLIMISAVTFGQKKEIKKAEKALRSNSIQEAIASLSEAEALLSGADDELKAQFYVIKGEAYLADAGTHGYDKMKISGESFRKATEIGIGKYADRAKIGMQNLRVALVNSAVEDQKRKNFGLAAEKLHASYLAQKDTLDLYSAAESSVLAKDYDSALKYYEKLLDLGYTGIRKEWIATDLETGKVVTFADENTRTTNMLSGRYTNPDDRMAESVRGDILRSVAIIYTSKGENDKAMAIMKEARAQNPDDISLIRAEADMVYKIGDMPRYKELMSQVIASDPNNPELYYNLGVGSAKNGETEEAEKYYKKALELDPTYSAAQINIAALLLSAEGAIVEEMNGLGTSKVDDARYDVLREKRKNLYSSAAPYLEAALKNKADNVEVVRTLMNIYSQLGEDEKFKAMKAKLQEMEGGQ